MMSERREEGEGEERRVGLERRTGGREERERREERREERRGRRRGGWGSKPGLVSDRREARERELGSSGDLGRPREIVGDQSPAGREFGPQHGYGARPMIV